MEINTLKHIMLLDYHRYDRACDGKRIFWGFIVFFRINSYFFSKSKTNKLFYPLFVFSFLFYQVVSHIYQIQIPSSGNIGGGIKFAHYSGIVVSASSKIGKNCTLHQNVTIGNGFSDNNMRGIIGDNVIILPGAVIAGHVHVGSHSIITANAVVTKDVPPNSTVGGIPGRVIGVYDDTTFKENGKKLYEVVS